MKKPKKLKPTTIVVGCDEQCAVVRVTDQRTLRFIAEMRREVRVDKRKFKHVKAPTGRSGSMRS